MTDERSDSNESREALFLDPEMRRSGPARARSETEHREPIAALAGHFANLPPTPKPLGIELKPRVDHNRPTGWGAPSDGAREHWHSHHETPDCGEDVGEEAEE